MKLIYNTDETFYLKVSRLLSVFQKRQSKYEERKKAFEEAIRAYNSVDRRALAKKVFACLKNVPAQRTEFYGFMNWRTRVVNYTKKELDFEAAKEAVKPHSLEQILPNEYTLTLELESVLPDFEPFDVKGVCSVSRTPAMISMSNRASHLIDGRYIVLHMSKCPSCYYLHSDVPYHMIQKLEAILQNRPDVVSFEEDELNELIAHGLAL